MLKVKFTHILILLMVFVALVGGNVYQWNNPKVVEVPEGQMSIDSTAWVQQAAYITRGMIIDSLRSQNEKLAKRISQKDDKIANYTKITGKLNLKVDSLESREPVRLDSLFMLAGPAESTADLGVQDTTVTFEQTFSDGLFRVQSDVIFQWPYLDNRISLTQDRPIRIDVANTMNDDRSRLLTYVTSPDFEDLQYQSYTELQQKNELPKFWIGVGSGVAATLTGILILK